MKKKRWSQLAGKKCAHCTKRFVVPTEATTCRTCGESVHEDVCALLCIRAPSAPKPKEPDIQLAGRRCDACGERIVLATEGLLCEQCGFVLHDECKEKHARRAHGPTTRLPYR